MVKEDFLCCPECDLLQQRSPARRDGDARCCRCGARLQGAPRPSQRLLPLALAALFSLGVVAAFPLMELDLKGTHMQATLGGIAAALYGQHMAPLAGLVIATTLVYPFLALCAMALHKQARQPVMVRVLRALHPWCMVEVFVLGLLVAYAKLSHMVPVMPGAAAWALGALVLLWTLAQREPA